MAKVHLADCSENFPLHPANAKMTIVSRERGVVRSTPQRRKVAIVAAGHGRAEAPYNDTSYEVWALNAVPPLDEYQQLRCDRWFEMHEKSAQSEKDMRWIHDCPVPLYIPPTWARTALSRIEAPMSVAYPLDEIVAAYGSYFACTFAYEMALAIYEGFEVIGIYGAELAFGTMRERTIEFANLSWWIGFAEGKGIAIELPSMSLLGRHKFFYGVDYDNEKSYVETYVSNMTKADKQDSVGG